MGGQTALALLEIDVARGYLQSLVTRWPEYDREVAELMRCLSMSMNCDLKRRACGLMRVLY